MLLFALLFFGTALSQLNDTCTQGDYLVSGLSNGKAVKLDFVGSGVSGSGVDSTLTLVFDVPSMLFEDDGVLGERAVQVVFHDRVAEPNNHGSCYSNYDTSSACPGTNTGWTMAAVPGDDGCMSTLTGVLNFDSLMHGEMSNSLIAVLESSRTINGKTQPTWELYMDAMVETWVPYSETSDLAGDGNLDFNNGAQTMPGDHLTIAQTQHQFYHTPFRISYPQQIEVEATSIRSSSALVLLYAVIDQRTLEINFDTTSGAFTTAEIKLRTQVQYPFSLIGINGDINGNGAATITKIGTDSTTTTNIDSIAWMSNTDTCTNALNEGDYCEQDWMILITPNQCDISGHYEIDFYAYCFTNDDGCALNFNETNMYDQTSNRWTGYSEFSVTAQEFCPTILDTVEVRGEIAVYASDSLHVNDTAVAGTNVFVNDHVYFEATWLTTSDKDGMSFGADDASLDDSIIAFVRPYLITMQVQMVETPLQYSIESSNSDVNTVSSTDYTVTLCEVTPLTFPYEGTYNDCFGSLGWNAANVLAFGPITPTGTNTIDPNEIAFRLRLDERVIPVDHSNHPSQITISIDTEIYYNGVTNPVRRRMLYRRDLQGNSPIPEDLLHQRAGTTTSMAVTRRPLPYCTLNPSVHYTGFKVSVDADPLELPTRENINDHVVNTHHQLSQYFGDSLDASQELHVVRVDRCVEDECASLYPVPTGTLDNSQRNTIDYYIDVRDKDAALEFQDDLYNGSPSLFDTDFMYKKALRTMATDHCDSELQGTFNDFRTSEDLSSEDLQAIEESSAAMFSIFVLSVLALLY